MSSNLSGPLSPPRFVSGLALFGVLPLDVLDGEDVPADVIVDGFNEDPRQFNVVLHVVAGGAQGSRISLSHVLGVSP